MHATRVKFEQWSDPMRQVIAAAPREPEVWEILQIAKDTMRAGLTLTAQQLAGMGTLRDGADASRATDLLWMHLCNAAYFIRADDLGWTLDESEIWLNDALAFVLFGHSADRATDD